MAPRAAGNGSAAFDDKKALAAVACGFPTVGPCARSSSSAGGSKCVINGALVYAPCLGNLITDAMIGDNESGACSRTRRFS